MVFYFIVILVSRWELPVKYCSTPAGSADGQLSNRWKVIEWLKGVRLDIGLDSEYCTCN